MTLKHTVLAAVTACCLAGPTLAGGLYSQLPLHIDGSGFPPPKSTPNPCGGGDFPPGYLIFDELPKPGEDCATFQRRTALLRSPPPPLSSTPLPSFSYGGGGLEGRVKALEFEVEQLKLTR